MKKLILGSLLAALVVFIWGFLYWNVLPLKGLATRAVPDEAAFVEQLRALPEGGTYEVPSAAAGASQDEYLERMGTGPIALIFLSKKGVAVPDPSLLLAGFVHMFITALLIGLVLQRAGIASYGGRFGLAFLAGLAAAVFANLGEPIWFVQPWGYHLLQAGYDLTVWILIGLVLAKFVPAK